MTKSFNIFIVFLLVGLVSLYRERESSQSALRSQQALYNTDDTKRDLDVGRYFVQNKNQSIQKRSKSFPTVDVNVCASDSDSLKKIAKGWQITERDEPNQSFKCDGVAKSFKVVSTRVKKVVNALDKAGLKKEFRQDLTCIDELKMRKIIIDSYKSEKSKKGHQKASKMIRMAFHDSIDFENLMSAQKLDNKVDKNAPQGLDFCLHTGLQEAKPGEKKDILGDDPDGNPNHNRGLNQSRILVEKIVKSNEKWTRADVLALGSVVAVEEFFKGPTIPFKMGRKVGDCKMSMCTQQHCEDTQDYFLIHEPSGLSMDPKDNMDFFKGIGFSMEEAVALMGAHTVGGVNVCTGNKNPNNEAWCKSAPKFPDKSQKGAIANLAQTYFDTTPASFDNQYFKELVQNYTTNLPTCDSLKAVTEKVNKRGKVVREGKEEEYCTEPICNAKGFKVRYTDKSSEGYEDRELRKVAYLPADWAFQANQTTADIEKNFADNQDKFWNVFTTAFGKVINRGYDENELNECSSVDCSLNGDKLECGDLEFKTGGDDCKVGEGENCKLTGGLGARGVINCGSKESLKCEMI